MAALCRGFKRGLGPGAVLLLLINVCDAAAPAASVVEEAGKAAGSVEEPAAAAPAPEGEQGNATQVWSLIDVPAIVCPGGPGALTLEVWPPSGNSSNLSLPHVLTLFRTSRRNATLTFSLNASNGSAILPPTNVSLHDFGERRRLSSEASSEALAPTAAAPLVEDDGEARLLAECEALLLLDGRSPIELPETVGEAQEAFMQLCEVEGLASFADSEGGVDDEVDEAESCAKLAAQVFGAAGDSSSNTPSAAASTERGESGEEASAPSAPSAAASSAAAPSAPSAAAAPLAAESLAAPFEGQRAAALCGRIVGVVAEVSALQGRRLSFAPRRTKSFGGYSSSSGGRGSYGGYSGGYGVGGRGVTTGGRPVHTLYSSRAARTGGTYGYSQSYMNRAYPVGFQSTAYGYAGRGAYTPGTSVAVMMGTWMMTDIAFSRMHTYCGYGSVCGDRVHGHSDCSGEACPRQVVLSEEVNRDDLMMTAFVPGDFPPPFILSITAVEGPDFAPERICPPSDWAPPGGGSKDGVGAALGAIGGGGARRLERWSPPPNQDLFVTLTPAVFAMRPVSTDPTAEVAVIGFIVGAFCLVGLCMTCRGEREDYHPARAPKFHQQPETCKSNHPVRMRRLGDKEATTCDNCNGTLSSGELVAECGTCDTLVCPGCAPDRAGGIRRSLNFAAADDGDAEHSSLVFPGAGFAGRKDSSLSSGGRGPLPSAMGKPKCVE